MEANEAFHTANYQAFIDAVVRGKHWTLDQIKQRARELAHAEEAKKK